MEVQLTDFENAAFAVFIVLLSRAILHFNLNLYIPISKVHTSPTRISPRARLILSLGGREHGARAEA